MADAQRTIELVFQGVDKTAAATQAALNNTNKFANNLQTATQPIADFTASAVKLEAGLLAAGVAVTAFSVKVASDFQSAVTDLSKVLSDTDNIEQYRDLAIDLSEAYGVSSVEIVKSIANYKQAGFSAKEASDLTKSGLDLVIAGSIDASRGADLLVASIKGFGAEASDSVAIVDLLNQVSNEYAASTEQLLEGFSLLSPVAKTAGLSLEETVGILTPGIEVFQSGSEVANALRTSLLRLVDDSKPVQEGLSALGVAQTDANGQLRSARDIYFDVAEALQGVDENQRLYIASQLVGIQRSSQFLAITDGLDKTLRIAGDGFEYLGSAAKEVEAQLATAQKAADRTREAFTNMLGGIGAPLLDEFSGVSDALTAIFRSIRESAESGDSGIAGLVEFVEGQFGELQKTLESVALNIPEALSLADFSGFIEGITAVSNSISLLFDGVDLSTAEGLASAITLVGKAFEGLSRFTGGVIESFKPLFDQIVNLASEMQKLDGSFFESAGNALGLVSQLNILTGAVNGVFPAVEALVGLLIAKQGVGLVSALTSAVGGVTSLGAALSSAGFIGAAGAAGFALGTLANEAAELVAGTSISTWVTDTLIDFGLLEDEATNIIDSINDVSGSAQNLNETPVNFGEGMESAARSAENLGRAATDAESKLISLTTAGEGIEDVAELYDIFTGKVIGYGYGVDEAAEATQSLFRAGESAGGAFSVVSNEFNKLTAAAGGLQEAVTSLSLEEKIALIESQTAISVAQIEADTERMKSAFESVDIGIQSTGESLNDLFGLLGNENISKLDKLDIEKQIQRENDLRADAFDLQRRLTEATIREISARTKALNSGQPLITVQGDGLEPHLEAFMWEIMRAIQVRVNEDGLSMLLGHGSGG